MKIFALVALPLQLALSFPCTTPHRGKGGAASLAPALPVKENFEEILGAPPQIRIRGPWEDRFQELVAFQQRHGHCQVPKRYSSNKPLANWVSKQRQEHRKLCNGEKASITLERIKALEEIGFCWNAQDTPVKSDNHEGACDSWGEQYQLLVDFMSENNLTSVSKLPRDSDHAAWIKQQRIVYRNDDKRSQQGLSPKRLELLRALDPRWHLNRYEVVWETRYQELVAYAREHGNCCVPISFSNKKLANWVSNQRKLYSEQLNGRRNSLDDNRKQRLSEIGFIWNRWDYEFHLKKVNEGPFLKL